MTLEEYRDKLNELKQRFDEEKKKLDKQYALANNEIEVGDIVIDHCRILRVERIAVVLCENIPGCYYYGVELRKSDMQPKKKQDDACIWQRNIKKIIKREENGTI